MNICLINLVTENLQNEAFLSSLNKKKYCEKYNLDYKFYVGRMSERHAQWDKIQCLIQNISNYDYVIWMDSDAVFNNFDISIIDIINENKDVDALFCHDTCYDGKSRHLMVNTGVMIFKNTDWSSALLNETWNSVENYSIEKLEKHSYHGYPHEQGKICDILISKSLNKYRIFNEKKFNTHPNVSNLETFIIHFMGSRQTQGHIDDFLTKVKEINNRLNILDVELSTVKIRKNKICVVSHFTENLREVGNLSVKNKQEYCNAHGYDFIYENSRLSDRHPAWDKVKLLLELLNDKSKNYDYFVWMDNDAFINNSQLRFDILCSNFNESSLLICSEPHIKDLEYLNNDLDYNLLDNLRIVNTGVFILKNNEWSRNFLQKVWHTKSNTNIGINGSHAAVSESQFNYNYWPFEQGAFHIVLSKMDKKDYKILNNKIMNSFYGMQSFKDFVCHFTGNGSNFKMIENYIKELNCSMDFEKLQILYSGEHSFIFLNSDIFLKYSIYSNQGHFLLKYEWDLSKANMECLSHSFKIVNKINNNFKIIDFESKQEGYFELDSISDIDLYHSYDWYGEKDWKKLDLNRPD
jgi:hypothetical protein